VPYFPVFFHKKQENLLSLAFCEILFDGLVKSQKMSFFVIPAKTGIQSRQGGII